MLFDASSSTDPNAKAQLASKPQEPQSSAGCLEFYYNAHGFFHFLNLNLTCYVDSLNNLNFHAWKGTDIDQLTVYALNNGASSNLLTIKGNQGKPWRLARIDLNFDSSFSIIFDATRSKGPNGLVSY